MQPEIYDQMARLEHEHFWFRARRNILQNCLKLYLAGSTVKEETVVLDAGCGTGANLQILDQYGKVIGIDLHLSACCHAAAKTPGQMLQGSLEKLPLCNECCSVATLLDVLEHVEGQQDVLGELFRVLSPGGTLMVTVPAFRHLWSGHDIAHQHRRRYRARELRAELNKAGFHIVYLSYFNTHLYPLIAVARLLRRQHSVSGSDMQDPHPWLNDLLYRIFSSERLWIGRMSMPFGVSLVAIAKKPLRGGLLPVTF